MRPLIRFSAALLFFSFSALNNFAGSGSVKPVQVSLIQKNHLQKLDDMLSKSRTILTDKNTSSSSAGSAGRICSCEILDMESINYHHQQVVLLAEKTNHGGSSDYTKAKQRIQKEKKHLKKMFYDKIRLVSEIQGTGSCKSMYFKLKTADSHLQLYEILNADVN